MGFRILVTLIILFSIKVVSKFNSFLTSGDFRLEGVFG